MQKENLEKKERIFKAKPFLQEQLQLLRDQRWLKQGYPSSEEDLTPNIIPTDSTNTRDWNNREVWPDKNDSETVH